MPHEGLEPPSPLQALVSKTSVYTSSTNKALCLVSTVGFEPTTTRFQGEDSTRLSYTELVLVIGFEPTFPWVKTTLPRPISRHKLNNLVLQHGIEPRSPAYKAGPNPVTGSKSGVPVLL